MDLNTIEDASKTERIPKGRIVDVYILAPNRLLYQYRFDCQMSTASALGSGRADPVGPRSVLGGFLAIACNRIRPH
jgi:hypothetical protein